MIIRKEDIVELWVDKLAFGGDGVARMDGFVVFVKGAVPGDHLLARIVKKKSGYANAVISKIIDASPERLDPPCPYSAYCGGCNYQHIRYEHQLRYKKEQVMDAVTRIGAFENVRVMDVIPSSNVFEYRNKMEFSFSDRRWILPDQFQEGDHDEAPALGLHVPGTFYKVIDIDSCMLQKDTGNIILREVRDFVKRSGIPVYGLKSHEGFWRFLALRYSTAFDEWMVNIVTSENRPDRLMPLVEILKDRVFNIKTIVNNIARRRAGVAVGEEETVLTGEGFIKERLEQYLFRISANSFFQTNTSGAEKLYSKVMEYAELTGVENVLDLYCGTGTIPVFLSGKAKKVTGMEIVESAVSDAKINCQLNSVTNCEFIPGDVKDTIPNLRENVDVLIVDPPRTGIHKDVLSVIMERAVKKIVYVSCNPSTLARDLEIMSEKYEILEIQPVDMFPHTYHIESVVKMIRR